MDTNEENCNINNNNNNPPIDGETPEPTPFSPEELLEQVNDQLEAELEKIEGIFATLLSEVKTVVAVAPTAERAPPASDLKVLREWTMEVDQTCYTYEELEPRSLPILGVPPHHEHLEQAQESKSEVA